MLSDILLPELPQQLEEERIKWLRDMDKPESIIRGQKPYQRIFPRWSKGIPFTKALRSMPEEEQPRPVAFFCKSEQTRATALLFQSNRDNGGPK